MDTLKKDVQVARLRLLLSPTSEELSISATGTFNTAAGKNKILFKIFRKFSFNYHARDNEFIICLSGSQSVHITVCIHPDLDDVEIIQLDSLDPPGMSQSHDPKAAVFQNPGYFESSPDPNRTAAQRS